MDVRDSVVSYVRTMSRKSDITVRMLVGWMGITLSKYYTWVHRLGYANNHNGMLSASSGCCGGSMRGLSRIGKRTQKRGIGA